MIDEHKDQLYRLCLYLEKNTDRAEELFQDTWVKAIEKFSMYNSDYPFYTWLTQVAVNTYRDKLRRLKLEFTRRTFVAEEVLTQSIETEENIEKDYLHKEKLNLVITSIGQLPDKYKLPLLLVFAEDMSYKEVAVVLGIDEGLVKSRIYEGRKKLKKRLSEEGLDD